MTRTVNRMSNWTATRALLSALVALSLVVVIGCGSSDVEPVAVDTVKEVPAEDVPMLEVVKEAPVEKVVIKEVVKEVPVEKVVTKEVVKTVEVPGETVVKEVVKDLPREPAAPAMPAASAMTACRAGCDCDSDAAVGCSGPAVGCPSDTSGSSASSTT